MMCSSFDDVTDGTVGAVLERMKSQLMLQTNVRRNDITSAKSLITAKAVHIINFARNCISSTVKPLYIIIAKENTAIRLMIYAFGDDIHAKRDDIPLLSQWIKNKTVFGLSYFWQGH